MIKLTIEFKTVDEAIVALGKLVAAGGSTQASALAHTEVVPSSAATTRVRKPRNDAGKARGPYKNAPAMSPSSDLGGSSVPDPAVAGAPVNAAPPGQPEADAHKAKVTERSAPAGEAPSKTIGEKDTEAQMALETVLAKVGLNDAMALLSRYGIRKLRDLSVELRAEFLKHAAEVAAGGEI